MPADRPLQTIAAEQLKLCLVARRIAHHQRRAAPEAGCRWAVIAAHLHDNTSCRQRRLPGTRPFSIPSMLSPMQRGSLKHAIERMRLIQGLPVIRQTFGCGLRAILEETESVVMR